MEEWLRMPTSSRSISGRRGGGDTTAEDARGWQT